MEVSHYRCSLDELNAHRFLEVERLPGFGVVHALMFPTRQPVPFEVFQPNNDRQRDARQAACQERTEGVHFHSLFRGVRIFTHFVFDVSTLHRFLHVLAVSYHYNVSDSSRINYSFFGTGELRRWSLFLTSWQ